MSNIEYRKLVLDYVCMLAGNYTGSKGVDPRATPVVLTLGRLIIVVDKYLSGGTVGLLSNTVDNIAQDAETTKRRLAEIKDKIDIIGETVTSDFEEIEEEE